MSVFTYGVTDLGDGFYVLRVDGKLCVAEFMLNSWYPTGVDYDPWQYTNRQPVIEVICALDLEAIAKAAESQL